MIGARKRDHRVIRGPDPIRPDEFAEQRLFVGRAAGESAAGDFEMDRSGIKRSRGASAPDAIADRAPEALAAFGRLDVVARTAAARADNAASLVADDRSRG